jgi:hypothetical protein
VAQAGGGSAISGLPAINDFLNATYAPTEALVEGYPAYSAGSTRHLFRHPKGDDWLLINKPFDPAVIVCATMIPAGNGPAPTGARAWTIWDGGKAVEQGSPRARPRPCPRVCLKTRACSAQCLPRHKSYL